MIDMDPHLNCMRHTKHSLAPASLHSEHYTGLDPYKFWHVKSPQYTLLSPLSPHSVKLFRISNSTSPPLPTWSPATSPPPLPQSAIESSLTHLTWSVILLLTICINFSLCLYKIWHERRNIDILWTKIEPTLLRSILVKLNSKYLEVLACFWLFHSNETYFRDQNISISETNYFSIFHGYGLSNIDKSYTTIKFPFLMVFFLCCHCVCQDNSNLEKIRKGPREKFRYKTKPRSRS